VDAHRVEVLDRADDDDIVVQIADHLELELVPATDRLLDEDLGDGALAEAPFDDRAELRLGVGETAAVSAERKCRAHDGRRGNRSELIDRRDDLRSRRAQPAALDCIAEE
jgi:hypothetical protein